MVQLIIQHVISMAAVILLYLLPYSYSVLRFSSKIASHKIMYEEC